MLPVLRCWRGEILQKATILSCIPHVHRFDFTPTFNSDTLIDQVFDMTNATNPIMPLKSLKMDSPLQHPIDKNDGQDTPLDNLEIFPDGHPTTLADIHLIDENVKTDDAALDREVNPDANSPQFIQQPVTISTANSTVQIPPSKWTPMCHPRMEEMAKEIDGEFLEHWGFPTEKAKKKFIGTGFSRVTCLFFPTALDDRLRFACRLLTILSLVDGACSPTERYLRSIFR